MGQLPRDAEERKSEFRGHDRVWPKRRRYGWISCEKSTKWSSQEAYERITLPRNGSARPASEKKCNY
jgi:hypothetical protein